MRQARLGCTFGSRASASRTSAVGAGHRRRQRHADYGRRWHRLERAHLHSGRDQRADGNATRPDRISGCRWWRASRRLVALVAAAAVLCGMLTGTVEVAAGTYQVVGIGAGGTGDNSDDRFDRAQIVLWERSLQKAAGQRWSIQRREPCRQLSVAQVALVAENTAAASGSRARQGTAGQGNRGGNTIFDYKQSGRCRWRRCRCAGAGCRWVRRGAWRDRRVCYMG
jgi:hypothetical protein